MWIMFLYRIDVGPLSDRYADIPTSYRYLSDMGMLTGRLFVFVFAFFLVLGLFYRSQMVNFKEKYHFSRFRRGSKFFQGGGGGGNCLLPIETQITCDFPGGSGPPGPSPLDPHLAAIYLVSQSAK